MQEVDSEEIGPATGVLLEGGAVFEDGTVVMASGDGIVSSSPASYAFVRDSTIRSREGIGIWAGGKFSLARSTVESRGTGIEVGSLGGNADLADTVVRTESGPALLAAYGASVNARHLTLLNDGAAQRGSRSSPAARGRAGRPNSR